MKFTEYRCLFFLRTAAQNLRTCTHRMYGRKNTAVSLSLSLSLFSSLLSYTHTHTRARARAHARTHAHTCAHTYTHTHTTIANSRTTCHHTGMRETGCSTWISTCCKPTARITKFVTIGVGITVAVHLTHCHRE